MNLAIRVINNTAKQFVSELQKESKRPRERQLDVVASY